MASTYSDLKIELIGTGDQAGTWGATTNTNLGTALEEAIVGRATANFTTDADLTLTLTNVNTTQVARHYILNVTSGVSLTATRNLIVPTIDKPYIIENNTTGGQSIVVKTVAGTGVTVPNGKNVMVYANSVNVVSAINHIPTLSLTTDLAVVDGGTGASDAATARTNLGLGTISTQAANSVAITGGAINGTTVGATTPSTGAFTTLSSTGNATLGDSTSLDSHTINGATAVSVNTTTDAFKITQTGAGNALVVEDSASTDSTPFVIDTAGRVLIGGTTNTDSSALLQLIGTNSSSPQQAVLNQAVDATAGFIKFQKSRAGAVVNSSDTLGTLIFQGHDGSAIVSGANINAVVDSTPSVGSMPTALRFNTTQTGSVSSVERMRIDSNGNVGIGGTGSPATKVTLVGTLPSASTVTRGFSNVGTSPTTSTTEVTSYYSAMSTEDGVGAIANLQHFLAIQGTITGGTRTAPNAQYGFSASATLIGATTNYGFFGNLAVSGTSRWNFYAAGTAPNYFNGDIGVGTSTITSKLQIEGVGETTAPTVGGAKDATIYVIANNNVADAGGGIEFGGKTNQTFAAIKSGIVNGITNGIGYLGFYTRQAVTDAAMTERMRIDSDGTVRITQTGAANAFVVNDESPETTPFVIDANGRVVSGNTTALISAGGLAPRIQSVGATNSDASIGVFRASADGSSSYFTLSKTRSALGSAFGTPLISGDGIGQILFTGDDGTTMLQQAASIVAFVDGAPSVGSMPAYLSFRTSASGSVTPTERMRIDSAGNVGIGTTAPAGQAFRLTRNITGSTGGYAVNINPTFQSDVTSAGYVFQSIPSTQATAFTLPNLYHFYAIQGTVGAGSTIDAQHGFHAASTLIGATNNYGFYGNIAAGTGRYNLYMGGTADNYLAGKLGIGATVLTGYNLRVASNLTGATNVFGIQSQGAVQSDVTVAAYMFRSVTSTQATTFTLPALIHYSADQQTFGAGSTVTIQYGYTANSTLIGATNNYGFYGDIAAGTGRWNFYANGTANNAYAGNSSFGKVTAPTSAVDTTSFARSIVTNTAATYTVLATDSTIIQTTAASTYTLPAASSFTGRILHIVTQFAGTVISASSNVVPLVGGAAGTAILAATAGKYAKLQSNGTNWIIIEAN